MIHGSRATSRTNFVYRFLLLLGCLSAVPVTYGQGAVDYTGTGGGHTIQGRIYFPSGRRADAPGLKIKLESVTSGSLSVLADSNGSFTFRNLAPGSYAIVIEGNDDYGPVRETVYIDDPGSSNLRGRTVTGGMARVFTVPIYLMPRNRTDARAGVLNAALASVPKAAADSYLKALEAAEAGNSQRAIEQLKSAISLAPGFPLALNELGVQYLKINQPDKAAEVLANAVRLVPAEFFPRLNYGIALLNQRKFAESEDELRIAITQKPTAPTARMYLGIALLSQKKLDEAEKELRLAVESSSKEVSLAHRYLGGIYWGRRDYQRAADELELYLKLQPNAPDAERTRTTIKVLRNKK